MLQNEKWALKKKPKTATICEFNLQTYLWENIYTVASKQTETKKLFSVTEAKNKIIQYLNLLQFYKSLRCSTVNNGDMPLWLINELSYQSLDNDCIGLQFPLWQDNYKK